VTLANEKTFATLEVVEKKSRRDKKYFRIKNGRNKRIKFAKPFSNVPQIYAQAINANGEMEVAEVVSVSETKARIKFSSRSTWIGWWEATPEEDVV